MAKSDKPTPTEIRWQLSNDGLRPTEAPWGFVVRNPVQRVIPPGAKIKIDLCVAASYPMLAWPARSHSDDVKVDLILQAGQDLIIEVENKSQHSSLVIDDKETLVNLCPLVAAQTVTYEG